MTIPVRTSGHTAGGRAWEEFAETEDASLRGLALRLAQHVERGALLHLTLPMPPHLRLFDDSEPTYSIYGVVRSVLPLVGGQSVRVKFLGKRPPRGHAESPGALYILPGEAAPVEREVPPEQAGVRERRRAPRYDFFMNLSLGRLAANGGQAELTVTENLSTDGARVPTTLPLSPGETVSVRELGGDFRTEAVARGVYLGNDRIRRVNLSFRDAVPGRLIATARG